MVLGEGEMEEERLKCRGPGGGGGEGGQDTKAGVEQEGSRGRVPGNTGRGR